MSNIEFYIILLPLIFRGVKEFPTFQKNYKYRAAKGYAYLVLLPVIFVSIGYISLENVFEKSRYFVVLVVLVALVAGFLSQKFFEWRVKQQKIKYGTERWFMTRFYRDVLYSILLF